MPIERRADRIRREREELHLRPWEFAPSQVTDADPSPWPEGTMGAISWAAAQPASPAASALVWAHSAR